MIFFGGSYPSGDRRKAVEKAGKDEAKKIEKIFKNPLTKVKECAIIPPVEINGASPSGKATDSDSVIS